VRELGKLATDGVLPDLTFLLDMPVAEATNRIGGRGLDRMESRGTEFLQAVRQGYLEELRHWPAPVAVIDARGSVEQVQQSIRDQLRAAGVLSRPAESAD
jgi:dTMP kinase